MKALALDPGKTTGYAIAYLNEATKEMEIEVDEEAFTMHEMYEFVEACISIGEDPNVHIIYEDFSYRNQARAGLDLTPVKLIGIIELYKERYEPFVGFHKQSAATGKAFWSDDKLKEYGIYRRGKKHGRDATRHLMQWLAFGPGSQYAFISDLTINLEVT